MAGGPIEGRRIAGRRRGQVPAELDRLPLIADALRDAGSRYGTPLYLTDLAAVVAAVAELRAAFPDPWIRQYSVKANDVPAVIAAVTEPAQGLGANVVSRGEWTAARAAGVPNRRITVEGIGKTDADLRAAVRSAAAGDPIAWLAVESADEAEVLTRLATGAGLGRAGSGERGSGGRLPLDVLFRLNPDVAPETHSGLAVGAGGSKFGMTETELSAAVELVTRSGDGLRPRGIHLHVGSQLGAVDAWRDAVRRGLALLALLRGSLPAFDTLDIGGGFGVAPLGEATPRPERFARELPALLDAIPADRRPDRMAVEPGRFLVARAGWLVGRVLHVRDRGDRQVVIDTGMTEIIRPALYGGRHAVVALTSLGRPVNRWPSEADEPVEVHGPICESTDALGTHPLPALRRGDLVAIRDAGAYAASLSSRYNGRPRPPQVMLRADGSVVLARRRGKLD
jgi:diaminopimelate decarboxylase